MFKYAWTDVAPRYDKKQKLNSYFRIFVYERVKSSFGDILKLILIKILTFNIL